MNDESHPLPTDERDVPPERSPLDVLTLIDARATQGIAKRDTQIAELEDERKNLRTIQQVTADVLDAARAERWAGAVRRLRRAKKLREQLTRFDSSDSLDTIEPWLTTEAESAINSLTRSLPSALGDETPDPQSRFPKFTFRNSFLTVEVKKAKFEAVVETRTGTKRQVAADAVEIAETVRTEIDRCFGRGTDLEQFARQLRTAHSSVAAERSDTSVPIRQVALAIDSDIALDEFSVDLARLIQAGPGAVPSADGLLLDHTKDIENGLQLPGLEQNGYYGTIRFESRTGRGDNTGDEQ